MWVETALGSWLIVTGLTIGAWAQVWRRLALSAKEQKPQRQHHLLTGSGRRVPVESMAAVSGRPIDPDTCGCGRAAHRNETVIVTDIATDYFLAHASPSGEAISSEEVTLALCASGSQTPSEPARSASSITSSFSGRRSLLKAVAAAEYDLVLMEYQMPEVDEYLATRAIRNLD